MSLDILRSTWSSVCQRRDLAAGVVENATHVVFAAEGRRVIAISKERITEPEAPGALWKAAIAFADDTERSADRWPPVPNGATR